MINNDSLVSVFEDYGPLKSGYLYKIMNEGWDYYVLRCHGKNINIPKKFINFNPETYKTPSFEQEEEDFENYLDDYYRDGV